MSSNETRASVNRTLTEVTELAARDEFGAALELISPLVGSHRNDPRVLGVLGGIYYRQENLEEAIRCFKAVTKLSPKSELASLGLFHSLWDSGDTASAEKELVRLLSIRDSEEYRLLLTEMGWLFENGALLKSKP